MKKKILIIGKKGFLSKSFLQYNFFKNKCIFINFETGKKNSFFQKNYKLKKKNFHNLIKKHNFKTVYLSSWLSINDPFSKKNYKNIFIYKQLINFFFINKISNIVFFGSIKEYGNIKGKITEKTKPKPNTYYAKAKLNIGNIGIKLAKKYNQNFLHLRVSNIFCAYKNKQKLFNRIYLSRKFTNHIGFNFYRNFIFIDDLFLILKHFTINPANGIFNLGSEKTFEFNILLDKYCKLLRIKPELSNYKTYYKFENYNFFNYSIAKLKTEINNYQSTNLKTCLKKILIKQKKLFLK